MAYGAVKPAMWEKSSLSLREGHTHLHRSDYLIAILVHDVYCQEYVLECAISHTAPPLPAAAMRQTPTLILGI